MDSIQFNGQVQFSLVISRRVNANAYLTRLNLCINGAYGPIDSELWLHRARTQAGDISNLEICSQIGSDNLNQYDKCYSKALPQEKERPFKTEAFIASDNRLMIVRSNWLAAIDTTRFQ